MTTVEVLGNAVADLFLPLLFFFALPFGSLSSCRQFIAFVAVVIHHILIPHFTTVVCIAGTIVVDDKIVLIKAVADHFLVAIVVDLIVNVPLVLNLVRRETLLAGGTEGPQLGQSVASRRHDC